MNHKLQLEKNIYNNMHPHRIRMPIKSIYRDELLANTVGKFANSLSGVIHAKANPITAKLLVIYNPQKLSSDGLKTKMNAFIKLHFKKAYKTEKTTDLQIFKTEFGALDLSAVEMHKDSISTAYHALDTSQIEKQLVTNTDFGLSWPEATQKLSHVGFNVITENTHQSILEIFLGSLKEFTVKILLGVSGISFLLGQLPEAIAVLGIVCIQTTLSSIQQYKSQHSLYGLKKLMVDKATVIRGRSTHQIEAKYLVPGDIVILETGDKVPADVRIIKCTNLKVNESSLTGETFAVEKYARKCNVQTELANRHNMLYMGANILEGRAKTIVVRTGMQTEMGNIAAMLQNIKLTPTPLENKISMLTRKMAKICLALCIPFSIGGVLLGKNIIHVLTSVVGFSLGALPESLPAVMNTAIAMGVHRTSKQNIIVRNTHALEALGCASVICCDKTGTLTSNEMTVKHVYINEQYYHLTGTGYEPNGNIYCMNAANNNLADVNKLLETGVICNNARLIQDHGTWAVQGDPTEGALLTAALKAGVAVAKLQKNIGRIKEIPFNSDTRYMTIVTKKPQGYTAYCKGALDIIMGRCTTIYANGKSRLFTQIDRQRIQLEGDKLAARGLRVLALAYKHPTLLDNIDNHYVFLGLVAMEDPPRPEVKKAIAKCHKAGIKITMITGDHPRTASSIAKSVGILTDGQLLCGSELDTITDAQLDANIKNISVFARTSPKQKHRIVSALKKAGHVVVMTGDGVNDTIAMKEADVGIAMGNIGSAIAKDVADITLVDDNFENIVKAIEEGRAISANIKNTMRYLLSGNLAEMLLLGFSALLTKRLPLLAIHILWVNAICETVMGVPIAIHPPSEDTLQALPVCKDSPLLDKTLQKDIFKRGITLSVATFGVYYTSLRLNMGIQKARTMTFAALISTQLINAYNCHAQNERHFPRYMHLAASVSFGMLVLILYNPLLNALFKTIPLSVFDWALLSYAAALSKCKLLSV